jgi:hypothetical protein
MLSFFSPTVLSKRRGVDGLEITTHQTTYAGFRRNTWRCSKGAKVARRLRNLLRSSRISGGSRPVTLLAFRSPKLDRQELLVSPSWGQLKSLKCELTGNQPDFGCCKTATARFKQPAVFSRRRAPRKLMVDSEPRPVTTKFHLLQGFGSN